MFTLHSYNAVTGLSEYKKGSVYRNYKAQTRGRRYAHDTIKVINAHALIKAFFRELSRIPFNCTCNNNSVQRLRNRRKRTCSVIRLILSILRLGKDKKLSVEYAESCRPKREAAHSLSDTEY